MKDLNYVYIVGFNTILKSTEEARALAKGMEARGWQANKVTYNEFLHAKLLAEDYTSIWDLIDKMQRAGAKTNSVTC